MSDVAVRPRRAPLLRIPPFPGCRTRVLCQPKPDGSGVAGPGAGDVLEQIRQHRVGGSYWGPQPRLPSSPYILVRVRDALTRPQLLDELSGENIVWWLDSKLAQAALDSAGSAVVGGECDPWRLLDGASEVIVDEDDELALLAGIAGLPVTAVGKGRLNRDNLLRLATEAINSFDYISPFTGEPIEPADAVSLCGFWRRLIDSNRPLGGAIGFAFWKRPTVAPLLWAGSGEVPFVSDAAQIREGGWVAVWASRTSEAVLAELRAEGANLVEVEDGFIRSSGLGADCIAPLSIVVDTLGIHFDPMRPSELESILQAGRFSPPLLERARKLRGAITASGISKYGVGGSSSAARASAQRLILVPGQVEDDRAVETGGCGLTSNLDLLRRVRTAEPEAHIIYKPHPDVEAGHRRGAIADARCRGLADEIVRDESISSLLERVDEVHVNTSLAGFEALIREKPVTTYGVPFYAGWGLTTDLGPVPERRSARRSLDELVAAALLLYPRYLDPETGLPCPAEILVGRLSHPASSASGRSVIVTLRRMQSRWRRRLNSLRERVSA